MFPIYNRLAWRTILVPTGGTFEGMFGIELRIFPATMK